MAASAGSRCSSASDQAPRSMASRASSDWLTTTLSVLACPAGASIASMNNSTARSTSPARRYASPATPSAVSRHGLHAGSASKARSASATAWSGPAGHMRARSMARADSNDAEPSGSVRSNEAVSTVANQRSAAAVCPSNAAIQQAATASGGYPSMASSPMVESQRWTVDIWPAW